LFLSSLGQRPGTDVSEGNFGVLEAPPLPSLIDILAGLFLDAALIQHRDRVLGNTLALRVKVDPEIASTRGRSQETVRLAGGASLQVIPASPS